MEITTGSIYTTNSCTNFTGGSCVQWTTVLSATKDDVQEMGITIVWTSFVFFSILLSLGRIVKVLFAKLIGGKK